MNLRVQLAGHGATWRFRDSDQLDAWLGTRPWWNQGGVRIIRIAGPELAGEMLAGLCRAIRAADHLDDLRIRTLSVTGASGGLRALIARDLGLREGLNPRDFLRETSLALRAPVAFITADVPPPGNDLSSEATALREDLARPEVCGPFTMLLFDTHDQPLAGDGYDLTAGRPVDGLLDSSGATEVGVWRGYLHYRLSWEWAGDLRRALGADEQTFAGLALGNEDGLEALLNRGAIEKFNGLDESVRRLTEEYLDYLAGKDRDRRWVVRSQDGLFTTGVLWKPPGQQSLRPVPWVARALLLRGDVGSNRVLLRGSLNCPYLAHELLTHCFDLEAQERAHLLARENRIPLLDNPDRRKIWDDVTSRRKKFRQGQKETEGAFYPSGCPAVPADEWDFTSFGEFLRLLPRDPSRTLYAYEILGIRNALAHSHYVGWQMIRQLFQARQRLGW